MDILIDLNGNLHKSAERLDAIRDGFFVFLPLMRLLRIIFWVGSLAFLPTYAHAQQNANASLVADLCSSISQSKFSDAPVVVNQLQSLYAQQPQAEFFMRAQQMRAAGYKTPSFSYLFARTFLQANPNLQKELLNLVPLFAERKVGKLALDFYEQVDAWQYNQQLLQTGNYAIRVQGNLSVRWQDADSTLAPTDNWDTPSDESPAETWIQYQVKSPGPVLVWTDAICESLIGKDSLRITAKQVLFSVKDRLFFGQNGLVEQGNLALPLFQINPRKGYLLSEEMNWKVGDRSIVGALRMQLKKKAGAKQFDLEFRSKQFVSEALQGKYFKGFGRLLVRGNQLGLLGSKEKPARLEIWGPQRKLGEILTSQALMQANESIQIKEGAFIGYVGKKDSLYHGFVTANWIPAEAAWHLKPTQEEIRFEDSFHQVSISADLGVLHAETQKMDFFRLSGKSQNPAWVESFDFFDAGRLDSQQGILTYDPIRILYNHLAMIKRSHANLYDIAEANKKDPKLLQGGFQQFKHAGYLNFDELSGDVSFTRLGRHYAQVKYAQKDFDRFYVPSFGGMLAKDTANISLDLGQQKLVIRGIKEVMVSDSLKANFIPSDNQIVFGQGRDFDFMGEIKIGNYRFRGQGFRFNFTDYSINLPQIDSITFVRKGTNRELGGQFRYEAGHILLAPPNNKSGRLGLAAFPKLIIPKGVVSYFDEPWRAAGVYSKKHYFQVPRIELDSLTQKEITFEGSFYSDGLFPTFKASLVLMPDQSFGFSYNQKLPFSIYRNKAIYQLKSPMLMNKIGLSAAGSMTYQGLISNQKESHFYPDSLIATSIEATMQGKGFPDMQMGEHRFTWTQESDSLWMHPFKQSISLYKKEVQLIGSLGMHQKQVFGRGNLTLQDGIMESSNFRFDASLWTASEANLKIGKQMALFPPSVFMDRVALEANMSTHKVMIRPMKGDMGSAITFPYVAYQSSLADATWDLTNQKFLMGGQKGFELKSLDSTGVAGSMIKATNASYDLKAQYLALSGVKEVEVGSALLYPEKGILGIQKDGAFKPFSGAKAVLNGKHLLKDLKISEGNSAGWKGEANYQFPRSDGDTVAVALRNFHFEGKSYITADGLLSEKVPLRFSKHQQFKGEVSLDTRLPNLNFKGFIRPVIGLPNFRAAWIPFESNKGEEPHLVLNKDLHDEAGRPITAGIFINAQNRLYPTFLSPQSDDLDPVLFQAEGDVIEANDRYEVKGKQTQMQLFIDKHRVEAEGPIQLFTGNQSIRAFGHLNMSTDSLLPRLDTWVNLQFPYPAKLLKVMGDRIVKYLLDEGIQSDPADDPERRDAYLNRAEQVLGKAIPEAMRTKMDQVHMALDKVAPEFANSINFSGVSWVWSPNTSAFYSVGGIPWVNVGPVDVNATVRGYMEVIKKPSKEEFYGYWELSEDLWYYFAYFNGELGVYSSDPAFLASIREAVKSDKKGKLVVVEAAGDEKDAFVKRFLAYYRGTTPAKKVKKAAAPVKSTAPATKSKKGGF
ncbi:hypothetical protein [Aquirufa echingensis]|uniref:Uncharacterized protein n=1 Tax=Aquirufa echingensis TaxID=3096516 RepID=A0ABW6CYK1_9BACT